MHPALRIENDSILVVHADGMILGPIAFEGVKPVARWHSQIIELRDDVELVQLAPNDRP